MKTSNFATWSRNREQMQGAISIARTPNYLSGWTKSKPECPMLFPPQSLLDDYKEGRVDWASYRLVYQAQLECLDLRFVWEYLHTIAGPYEPILLCWESRKTLDTNPCHRRLAAQYLGEWVCETVDEWEPG